MPARALSAESRLGWCVVRATQNPATQFSIIINDLEFLKAPITLDFKCAPRGTAMGRRAVVRVGTRVRPLRGVALTNPGRDSRAEPTYARLK